MATWLNDGLLRKFGPDRTIPQAGGEYRTVAELREIEVKIDLTKLTETETVLSDTIFFPKGMKIEQIDIFVDTAAATGTAIDVGLVKTDRTTEIDYDGFLAAFVTATMTAGAKITLAQGGTQAGALVGGTTSSVGYITASRTSATAFTAGSIRVRIRYSRA